MEDPAI